MDLFTDTLDMYSYFFLIQNERAPVRNKQTKKPLG